VSTVMNIRFPKNWGIFNALRNC